MYAVSDLSVHRAPAGFASNESAPQARGRRVTLFVRPATTRVSIVSVALGQSTGDDTLAVTLYMPGFNVSDRHPLPFATSLPCNKMIASPGAVTVIRPVVGGGGLAESRRTESTATTGGTTIRGGGTAATEDSAFTGGGGGCTVRDGAKKRIPMAISASAAAPTTHGVGFDRCSGASPFMATAGCESVRTMTVGSDPVKRVR